MSTYNYSITTDFSGNYKRSNFIYEIYQSSLKSLITKLTETDDNVEIKFKVALDSGQEAILNNLVSTHDSNYWSKKYCTYVEDNNTLSTTSTSYQQKIKLTTDYLFGGEFIVRWFYKWGANNTSDKIDVKIELDDSDILFNQIEDARNVNDVFNVSGFKKINLSRGIHTIDLDFRTSNINNEVHIDDARFELTNNM